MTSDTIPAVLVDAADRFPDREAIVEGSTRWTYAELLTRAEKVAAALIASGVSPGDRVAVWAPNSALWIALSQGIAMTGAVLVPFNTRFRREEAAHVLRVSGARLVITVNDFAANDFVGELQGIPGLGEIIVLTGDAPAGTTSWQEFLDRATDETAAEVPTRIAAIDPDDTSDIIFTSGTTGAPKGAMLTHGASVRTYRIWSDAVGLREGDRHLVVYPFFHTAGLKSGVLASFLMGATVYPMAVFDVPAVLELVDRERLTVLPGPPTVFQSILDHPDRESYDLSSVRAAPTGASVVPVEVIRQMREVLGIPNVVTGYGMTETTGTISMCHHDDPPEVIANTVGRPLPGVEVRVIDDDDNDVEPGTAGELIVRGFNLLKGYFGDQEATSAAFLDDWLRTGDVGFLDDDGNIHITDRKKDMFIVGGFNAYPAEIEALMLDHPAITQVAVVGVPDPRMGEVGEAFVVLADGASADPAEIAAWCKEHMANYKVPRIVHIVDALPLTPSGKVMKFELRKLVGED